MGNANCPNDGRTMRLVHYRTRWRCDYCGALFPRSSTLTKTIEKENKPLLWLRSLFS